LDENRRPRFGATLQGAVASPLSASNAVASRFVIEESGASPALRAIVLGA
jgi:hypothetical protein